MVSASAAAASPARRKAASSRLRAAHGRFRARQPDRLLGRGADHDFCVADGGSITLERHRDPECRPVVGRAGRAFEIGGATAALRRHHQLGDQLVAPQHGLVIAGEQILDRDRALAGGARHRNVSAERDQHRRQIHVRVGMGEMSADGRDVAHPHIGERAQASRDHRRMGADRGVALEHGQRRHGADLERAVGPRLDSGELQDGAQADEPDRDETRPPSSSASGQCRRRSDAPRHHPDRAA